MKIIKPNKHKKCHRRPGGAGMYGGNCSLCGEEWVFGCGDITFCDKCMIEKNLCYVCGKEIKK